MRWPIGHSELITLNLATPRRSTRSLAQTTRVMIPTDLMFCAFRQLFPAERMVVFGGRRARTGVRLTSVTDVTEARPSVVHVRASAEKLAQALIDMDRTGAHWALWLHSHPGKGAQATWPSDVDRRQEDDLLRHYSGHLLCAIAVADGAIRLWGRTVGNSGCDIRWRGQGVHATEADDVWQLVLA